MGEEKKNGREKTKISWQNKDIAPKSLAKMFRGKSFAVYGVNVPGIMDIWSTNLPLIEARELRLDSLFLLADSSYAIVDYVRRTNRNTFKYAA